MFRLLARSLSNIQLETQVLQSGWPPKLTLLQVTLSDFPSILERTAISSFHTYNSFHGVKETCVTASSIYESRPHTNTTAAFSPVRFHSAQASQKPSDASQEEDSPAGPSVGTKLPGPKNCMKACAESGVCAQPTLFFCQASDVVLPQPGEPAQPDYFAIMEMDRSYRLDEKQLEDKYKQLQRVLHPDKFANSPEDERLWSAEQSSLVNTAVAVLRSPLRRAQYLLKLNGVDTDEEGTIDDPELLSEVMEARMAVEEAESQEELRSLCRDNRSKQRECEEKIACALDSHSFNEAASLTRRMTYICRIAEAIKDRID